MGAVAPRYLTAAHWILASPIESWRTTIVERRGRLHCGAINVQAVDIKSLAQSDTSASGVNDSLVWCAGRDGKQEVRGE